MDTFRDFIAFLGLLSSQYLIERGLSVNQLVLNNKKVYLNGYHKAKARYLIQSYGRRELEMGARLCRMANEPIIISYEQKIYVIVYETFMYPKLLYKGYKAGPRCDPYNCSEGEIPPLNSSHSTFAASRPRITPRSGGRSTTLP